MPAISPTRSPRQVSTSRSDRPLDLDVQPRAGVEPSEHPAPMETSSESTLHCRLAEREDRTHPRVDHRTGVMLARLRALREWLLRRNGALAMHWDRVSHGPTGGSWSEFCAKIAALRPGRLWRYAQAGDLPGYGPAIDGTLLRELVAANTGKKAIAFTHKHVLGDDPVAAENRHLIAGAVTAGFTVNLSANNPAQADKLAELGLAPVVTVLARDYARRAVRHRFKRRRDEWAETIGEWRERTASLPRYTPAGRRIAVCPRPIRTRPTRAVAPAPMPGMPQSAFRPTAPGGKSKPPPLPATCPSATAGPSATTARWPEVIGDEAAA